MLALVSIFIVVVTFTPMKWWSLTNSPQRLRVSKFFFWILPFPSTVTTARIQPLEKEDRKTILFKLVSHLIPLMIGYSILPDLNYENLNPYLGSFLALCFWSVGFDSLGLFAQLVYSSGGKLIPHPNRKPSRAKSLGEFWGTRWNCWTHDWFKEACFDPFKRKPYIGLFLVFLVSGLWHEIIANGVIYLVLGKVIFGNFILFFLIQAIGILLEKRLRVITSNFWIRKSFFLSFILIPLPLLGNESMIRILAIAS